MLIRINKCLLFLGMFLSQFYFIDSGKPQVSHILLLLFTLLTFFIYKNKISKGFFEFRKLIVFFFYVLFVNVVWMIIEESTDFMTFNVFLIYNILVAIAVYSCMDEIGYKKVITNSLLYSIVSLLLLYFLGFGGYQFPPRYNGFFNDPNQMALWTLCSLVIIFILSDMNKMRKTLVLIISIFLCLLTLSRSGIIGLLPVIIAFVCFYPEQTTKKINKIIIVAFSIIVLVISIFFTLTKSSQTSEFQSRVDSTDLEEQMDVRGYSRITKHYEYLVFGAGQGLEARFSKTGNEIHSTWAGFLFYYGIVGFSLFFLFLFSIFYNLRLYHRLLFLSPLLYGFTTFGARTPIFFIFITIVFYISKKTKKQCSAI